MLRTEEHRERISRGYKSKHYTRTKEHKEALRLGQLKRWHQWRVDHDKLDERDTEDGGKGITRPSKPK